MGKYLPSHITLSRYIHRKYCVEANHHIPLSVLSRGSWKLCSYYHHLLHCHCLKSVQIRSFFWSVFSRVRIEYGEIRIISPYSVRMRKNTNQKKLRIWTLHIVYQPLISTAPRDAALVRNTETKLKCKLAKYTDYKKIKQIGKCTTFKIIYHNGS